MAEQIDESKVVSLLQSLSETGEICGGLKAAISALNFVQSIIDMLAVVSNIIILNFTLVTIFLAVVAMDIAAGVMSALEAADQFDNSKREKLLSKAITD
jgi:hypothetical protein